MSTLRLVIADDHLLFRQGLRLLLKSEPERRARRRDRPRRRAARRSSPARRATSCSSISRWSGTRSPTSTRSCKRVPVIVLTASEVPADAVAAVRKGARAVVFKRFAVETLMDAIRMVASGNVWLPASLQTQMAERLRARAAWRSRRARKRSCATSGRECATPRSRRALGIGEETVKTHLTKIFRKVGVRDRIELALYAARTGSSLTLHHPRARDGD